MDIYKATAKYLEAPDLKNRTIICLTANKAMDKFEALALPKVEATDSEDTQLSKLTTQEVYNIAGEKIGIYSDREQHSGYYFPELAYDYAAIRAMAKVPVRKFRTRKGTEYHIYPATDTSVLALKGLFKGRRIVFTDEQTRTLFISILAKDAIHSKLALTQAKFKQEKIVPKLSPYIDSPEGITLSDYQKTAIQMCLDSEGLGLFMEQGTGKTCVSVTLINAKAKQKRVEQGKGAKILIVGPKNVVSNWNEEFEKFSTVKGSIIMVRGTADKRVSLIAQGLKESMREELGFVAYVYSYGSMVKDSPMLSMIPFDMIITDESHNFKAENTQRWKALKELRNLSGQRFALTGTPIANSITDVFTQLEFLDEGRSGFTSLGDFTKFYVDFVENSGSPGGIKLVAGYQNVPFLQEKLAQTTFSISKKEAGLDLPDIAYETISVEATIEQQKAYVSLANLLAAEINVNGESSAVEVNNALVKLLRLAQICSGHLSVENERGKFVTQLNPWTPESAGEPNPKIAGVLDLLLSPVNDPNMKTVIWATFVNDIKTISEALDRHKINHHIFYGQTSEADRDRAILDFNNDPDCKVLICNPAAAGEGLNLLGYNYNAPKEEQLPTYCGQMIFFSCNWSMIHRGQAEARGHRRGLRKELGHQLKVVDLIILGTVDEMIRERVKSKQRNASLIADISDVLKTVLKPEFNGF